MKLTNCKLIAGSLIFIISAVIIGCTEEKVSSHEEIKIFPSECITEQIPCDDRQIDNFIHFKDSSGKTVGYKIDMTLKSRSGPFNIAVSLDANACVLDAAVTAYRAKRGRQIRSKAFTGQFTGKCPGEPLELGIDIDAVSGATLSSIAMTDGIKKAVRLTKSISSLHSQ